MARRCCRGLDEGNVSNSDILCNFLPEIKENVKNNPGCY